jgi:predicted SnoaL-like aldol condensation-catalyzing enzyme
LPIPGTHRVAHLEEDVAAAGPVADAADSRLTMTTLSENKALVLKAFDTLFNKRDYEVAARFWSPNYIQHSAHIAPGRDGLFNLVRAAPAELRYENAVAVADDEYVLLHGRFTGHGRPRAWIAADIVRVANGVLAEHWDAARRSHSGGVEERAGDVWRPLPGRKRGGSAIRVDGGGGEKNRRAAL